MQFRLLFELQSGSLMSREGCMYQSQNSHTQSLLTVKPALQYFLCNVSKLLLTSHATGRAGHYTVRRTTVTLNTAEDTAEHRTVASKAKLQAASWQCCKSAVLQPPWLLGRLHAGEGANYFSVGVLNIWQLTFTRCFVMDFKSRSMIWNKVSIQSGVW